MLEQIWRKCLKQLEIEMDSQGFNTWIVPLQALEKKDKLDIFAPNQFVFDWVKDKHFERIKDIVLSSSENDCEVSLFIGSVPLQKITPANVTSEEPTQKTSVRRPSQNSGLRAELNFDSFVEGKSNQLARAAALQVSNNPGKAYNPLFISGGVGLGKTHLMHAVGNLITQNGRDLKAIYLHSERFVADMVRALQHNKINEFKRYYRSVDALLIDDIQFFSGKDRSQEEFFHTFNALLEGDQQIVLTCDRYPREVAGVEERLKSRFGWGLTVAVEPPELETRVAILMKKANSNKVDLPHEVAFL